MDIPHKIFKISILLTQDGLVTVLEKMTMAIISAIEGHCISRQKPPHQTGYGNLPCSK